MGSIDFEKLDLSRNQYYRYEGSLTTPPCTQQLAWTVMKQVLTCTREQVELFKTCEHLNYPKVGNNRPLQPLYGRVVQEHHAFGTLARSTTGTPVCGQGKCVTQ